MKAVNIIGNVVIDTKNVDDRIQRTGVGDEFWDDFDGKIAWKQSDYVHADVKIVGT